MVLYDAVTSSIPGNRRAFNRRANLATSDHLGSVTRMSESVSLRMTTWNSFSMNRILVALVATLTFSAQAAPPGFESASLATLHELQLKLPLPTWIPPGFRAEVTESVFNVGQHRYITVEYKQKDVAKSFSFQFAAVKLGAPIFADERAAPVRVDFQSVGLGKSHFLTAIVRGLPECQTPWIDLKLPGYPKYGSFVSLGLRSETVKKVLVSVRPYEPSNQ